jgi:NAD(P)-dependent dehydrogenase (short-subunit alcohol dehydrogenase family)
MLSRVARRVARPALQPSLGSAAAPAAPLSSLSSTASLDASFDLRGRNAIVTGASSGLGNHFARVLASRGCRVAVLARREERLSELVALMNNDNGECVRDSFARRLDVTDTGQVGEVLRNVGEELGGQIDIVVNNAGVGDGTMALDTTEDEYDRIMDTNQKGCFFVAQAAAAEMVRAGNAGSIINVASVAAFKTLPGLCVYSASKAGLVHMTRGLATEWARHGIRVNAICPGYISTEMNAPLWETEAGKRIIKQVPQRRLGTEQDLDGALMLLASDAGAFMTGACINVDGGLSL